MSQTVFFRASRSMAGHSGMLGSFMITEFAFWLFFLGFLYHFAGGFIYQAIFPVAKFMDFGFEQIPLLNQVDFTGLARDFRDISKGSYKDTMMGWTPWGIVIIPVMAVVDNALTLGKHAEKQD